MNPVSFALGAFAACVLFGACSANATTVPGTGGFVTVGNDLTSAADLGRMWQRTQGLGAKAYMPAQIGMSSAANGIRVAGAATATIGGRTVPLTLISRLPVSAVANAARGVAMLSPASAAVTLLGFAAMNGWLTPAGLEWNTDPSTNVQKPFVGTQDDAECNGSFCLQYAFDRVQPLQWGWSKESALEQGRAWYQSQNPGFTCARTGQQVKCVGMVPDGYGGTHEHTFYDMIGYATRQAPLIDMPKQPLSWDEAMPRLDNPNLQGVDWKGITQQLLNRGAQFPADVLKDGTVSGPASQPGERTVTVGKRNPADPNSETVTTTKTTTNNYTYNNTTVTYNITTKTEVRDEEGNLIDETTETTEEPDEEPAQDTPLPDVPDFYEQKYPDGLAGGRCPAPC